MTTRSKLLQCLLVTVLCLIPFIAQAVPPIMSYQGKLNDNHGVPVEGSVSIIFTIYDESTGSNALWTETWSSVNVIKGLFSIELGTINPLVPTIFDKDNLYLGIKVGDDDEMRPLQRFTSGAYAFRAAPIAPILSSGSSSQGKGSVGWFVFHSITVPTGEIWEIYSAWLSNSSAGGTGYGVWCASDIRMTINGLVFTPQTTAGHGSLLFGSYPGYSTWTGFFSVPVKAYAGQIVSIQGAVGCDGACNYSQPFGGGFFYYKKTP